MKLNRISSRIQAVLPAVQHREPAGAVLQPNTARTRTPTAFRADGRPQLAAVGWTHATVKAAFGPASAKSDAQVAVLRHAVRDAPGCRQIDPNQRYRRSMSGPGCPSVC